jgi:hypothetical protein
VNKPNPPPALPKEKDPHEVFDRWLYLFWEWVSFQDPSAMTAVLGSRTFAQPPVNLATLPIAETNNILQGRVFAAYPTPQPSVTVAGAEDILKTRIFGDY